MNYSDSRPNEKAILLLAHGTPNILSDMPEYLQKVTAGRPMPQHVIAELQHRYAAIGLGDDPLPSGPPLTRWTTRQAQLLADRTRRTVYVGMRNWHPFIADTVARMKAEGVTHATILCLAPQSSRTSTGLYKRALDAALDQAFAESPQHRLTYDFISTWATDPHLIRAFAERLWPIWAEACAITGTHVPVLFTAHSVPCRTILSTQPDEPTQNRSSVPADVLQDYGPAAMPDPYPVECKQTAAAVAKLLAPVGLTDSDWYFAFQSQSIAGTPWIGPTVEDTLKSLAEGGHRAVVLQPIGFLCDHVEILYDIDIHFREVADALGMKLFRPESLNDSPTLIHALAHVLNS
jgi:ferrochelatase